MFGMYLICFVLRMELLASMVLADLCAGDNFTILTFNHVFRSLSIRTFELHFLLPMNLRSS